MEEKNPILILGLSFLVGVLLTSSGTKGYAIVVGYSVLIALMSISQKIGLIPKNLFSLRTIIILSFPAIILGIFYYSFYVNFQDIRNDAPVNKEISLGGLIVSDPKISNNYQLATVEIDGGEKITVITELSPILSYGDRITLSGKITDRRNPNELPAIVFPDVEITSRGNGFFLKKFLINFKNHLVENFKLFLPPDPAALMSGITLGHRSNFTPEFKNMMALSGTTHIVALSGYNIAILIIAIGATLGNFISRRKTFFVTAAIIILFVTMTGGEASIIRAAIMGLLFLLAKELGRPHNTSNAIVIAAVIMTIVKPTLIFYDIGFQLSFLALLGIIHLKPVIDKLLSLDRKAVGFLNWKENASTTLSAQLVVAPVIVNNFHQFSLSAIPANILILEIIPFTMFMGFTLAFVGLLSQFAGIIIAKISAILLGYQTLIIKIFSHLAIPIGNLFEAGVVILIYYFILLGLVIKFHR